MKKFAVLALVAAFILSSVGVAQAVEVKAKGTWRVHFNYLKNADFDDVTKEDTFAAMQRMRTIFEFIANENLRGVLQVEIGDITWGRGPAVGRGAGGAIGTDGVNIETRHAFINFKVPNTAVDIKAGLQPVGLPATLGSHILLADVAAVVANVPFNDTVSLTLGWARAFDMLGSGVARNDEVDVFLGVLPVNLDGARLQPFVAVSRWSEDLRYPPALGLPAALGVLRDKNATMWHAGLNYRVTKFDPIRILGDLNYGTVEWGDRFEQSGWMGLLAVEYAMDMVTPRIFGVYESGEESGFAVAAGNESNRMPVINTEGAFGPGIGYGRQTAFAQDRFLRDLLADFDTMDHQVQEGAVGLWALGFALRDIEFMDKLSHEFVVFHAQGTNHRANVNMLTTEDSYLEMNFNTRYQMYENLALILELAYGEVDFDALAVGQARVDRAPDAMTRAALGLVYRF